MADEDKSYARSLMDAVFGEDGSKALPDDGEGKVDTPGEAADAIKRRQWRRQKVDAMTRGEDFPSFSEWKAQQG